MLRVNNDSVKFVVKNPTNSPVDFNFFGAFAFEETEAVSTNLLRSMPNNSENFIHNPNTDEYYVIDTATRFIYALDSASNITVSFQLPVSFVFSSNSIGYNPADDAFRISGSYLGDNGNFVVNRNTFAISYTGTAGLPITNIAFDPTSIVLDNYIYTLNAGLFTITTPSGEILQNLLTDVKELLLVNQEVVVLSSSGGVSNFYTFSFSESLLEIDEVGFSLKGLANSYANYPAKIEHIKIVTTFNQLIRNPMRVKITGNNQDQEQEYSFAALVSAFQPQAVIEKDLAEYNLMIDGETAYSISIEPNTTIYLEFTTKRMQL